MNPLRRFTYLALALSASMLWLACGGDSSTTPAPAPAPAPPPAPPPPPTPEPEPEPPAAPARLHVSGAGLDFIEWSWTPVEGADGYDVQFTVDEAFTDEDEITARAAAETSYRREDLESGTSYSLRVRAAAGTGEDRITSGWSAQAGGTTHLPEPPAAPAGLHVSGTGPDFIEWSWTPVEGADGYDVQLTVDEAFTDEDEIIARTAEETSYRREDPAPGTSYYLRVRSAAGTGAARITSDWSDPEAGKSLLARTTSDRPDDFSGPQIHVVYAVAADGEDFELDTSGKIVEMLGNMQNFLAERIDQVFRIDTFEGEPDVTFVRFTDWDESDLLDLSIFHQGLQKTIPVVHPAALRQALDQEIATDPDKYYAVF